MKSMTTAEARENFAEVINRSSYGKERVVLTRRGKDIAAIISIEDLALLELAEDRVDLEDAKKALIEAKNKGTTSLSEFREELELDD
jgi:prevent-host-death family protein